MSGLIAMLRQQQQQPGPAPPTAQPSYAQALQQMWQRLGAPNVPPAPAAVPQAAPGATAPSGLPPHIAQWLRSQMRQPPVVPRAPAQDAGPGLLPPPPTFLQRIMRGGLHPSSIRIDFHRPPEPEQ